MTESKAKERKRQAKKERANKRLVSLLRKENAVQRAAQLL